jgi:hypothetical protein
MLINPYMFQAPPLGELWLYGTYTNAQALVGGDVFWNAETVDTLNAWSSGVFATVPAGVGRALLSARWFMDGIGGSAAGNISVEIQLSTNGGASYSSVASVTFFHPGSFTNTAVEIPPTSVVVAPGNRIKLRPVSLGGGIGNTIYQNNPSVTYLRATWYAS